jgi:hypothetical protein
MRKLLLVVQWLIVTTLAAFVLFIILRPTPQPAYNPADWRNWNGVTVISYPGITRRSNSVYPSAKQLELQLTALRQAGYQSVHPEDIRAWLDERSPLPEKALLIVFEGGRKEAFIRATPILQRTGFTAVLAVPTSVMSKWGSFYMRKKDIARITKLPQWRIGSMGHRAITATESIAPEEKRSFLTQRILYADGQLETTQAFRERIDADYKRSACLLREASAAPVALYLYPFADAGQSVHADTLAEAVNREAVVRHFDLAFIGSSNAFNAPGSDPWTLTRLRVPGNWTPEQLLLELSSNRPRTTAMKSIGSVAEWRFEGDAEILRNKLHLNSDASAWLRGTENWRDCEVTVRMQGTEKTIASLYARASSPRSWLRVTLRDDEVAVQECSDNRVITLYRKRATPSDQQSGGYQLHLLIRNNRAWLWLDGNQIAANLPLSAATQRGRVGIGAQQGVVEAGDFSARPLTERWLITDHPDQIKAAGPEELQAIVPEWFKAAEKPELSRVDEQTLLYASVRGIHTYPLLSGGNDVSSPAGVRWIAEIDEMLQQRDLKMLLPAVMLEGVLPEIADELRTRGYRVFHLLNPAQAMEWGALTANQYRDEVIVINGDTRKTEFVLNTLLRTVPAYRLAQIESIENSGSSAPRSIQRIDSVSTK